MDDRTFENVYLPRYAKAINSLARKLARGNRDLYEDLQQVGRISLWRLQPEKAKDNEDAWVRQALWNNMANFLRKERLGRLVSLDLMLDEGGVQVFEDHDGGPRLIAGGDQWDDE